MSCVMLEKRRERVVCQNLFIEHMKDGPFDLTTAKELLIGYRHEYARMLSKTDGDERKEDEE